MLQPFKVLKIDAKLIFFQLATPVSPIRGVVDSLTQPYGESATLRINDTRSRRLPTILGVGDSPYHWCGESTTLRIIDTESFL